MSNIALSVILLSCEYLIANVHLWFYITMIPVSVILFMTLLGHYNADLQLYWVTVITPGRKMFTLNLL